MPVSKKKKSAIARSTCNDYAAKGGNMAEENSTTQQGREIVKHGDTRNSSQILKCKNKLKSI